MKTPKITKLLPLALALVMTTSVAFADGEDASTVNNTNKANYTLNLAPYFDIDVTAPAEAKDVNFDDEYTLATINGSLVGTYTIQSNTTTKDVYLYGTCNAGGAVPALYGDVDDLKLVFTNTGMTVDPQSVENIRNAAEGATTSDNPDAVAFRLTVVPVLSESLNDITEPTATVKEGTNNVKYTIPNCKAVFTCTVTGSSVPNTFSTKDTNGTYQATLYMSETAQTL